MGSLTKLLLASDAASYKRATNSPFLAAAAAGTLTKPLLSQWLANDRLYIHAYIHGLGLLLSSLQLPVLSKPSTRANELVVKLLDWAVDALVNIRREERLFVEAARRFGLDVDLPTQGGEIAEGAKIEGLRRFENLFASVGHSGNIILPWLESALLFYATERCYLDAWAGVKARMGPVQGAGDADGGALRDEFIPNWTSSEFGAFVERLGAIVDDAVALEVSLHGEGIKGKLLSRAQELWREVLAAEETFWPKV
jgi:thiaminase